MACNFLERLTTNSLRSYHCTPDRGRALGPIRRVNRQPWCLHFWGLEGFEHDLQGHKAQPWITEPIPWLEQMEAIGSGR